MNPFVVGLDLSLTASGVAQYYGVQTPVITAVHTIKPPMSGADDLARIRYILSEINTYIGHPELVVIEGLAYAARTPGTMERAGLWYATRLHIGAPRPGNVCSPRPEQLIISPARLKKFVTGNGHAEKSLMLREIDRMYHAASISNDNEADAYGLMAIGCCYAGYWPPKNKIQRDIIDAIKKGK